MNILNFDFYNNYLYYNFDIIIKIKLDRKLQFILFFKKLLF